jgi:DNA polymerase I
MRTVICDIETDGLDNVRNIWCIVCKDILSHEIFTFSGDSLRSEFKSFAQGVECWIGHNFIRFDGRWITRLLDIPFSSSNVIDTLVLSRMLRHDLEGGHSLEAWGNRLRFPKTEFNDFDKFSDDMLKYCINDVELNHRVYNFIMSRMSGVNWVDAIRVEMEAQFIALDMQDNGFKFNFNDALKLYKEVMDQVNELDNEINKAFPPRTKLIREINPSITKAGTLHRKDFKWYDGSDYTIFSEGCPFSLFEWEAFNPGSPKQVIDRLWEAGWEPVEKTKGHIRNDDKEKQDKFDRYGWSLNEANLSTLPVTAPYGATLLVRRMLLAARLRTLNEWFQAYNPQTERVHGTFDPLGTRTQRCSHSKPNLGNIATAKSIKYNTEELRTLATELGSRMRKLWICDDDAYLVGCDMESAHLRIFGHLIDDQEYIQSLLTGDKKHGTDPHSLNKRKLGEACVDRDRAKTFIFSFLNGAGGNKVGPNLRMQ